MANFYLHDPELGIHYQEDKDMSLWVIKTKDNAMVLFVGSQEEIDEYCEEHERVVFCEPFSQMLTEFSNLVGDVRVLPVMSERKFGEVSEQVL